MATAPDPPSPPVRPRPGVAKALGICNLVFSALLGFCLFTSTISLVAISARPTQVSVAINPPAPTGPRPMISFDPFMGMNDIHFVRFCYVDVGTGFILNGLMFATGIGLINLKRWGARWWTYLAWTKIVRLVLLWGYYVVAVSPPMSRSMAQAVSASMNSQLGTRGAPSVGDLTRVYAIMNLIVASGMIVGGVLYPAVSLWLIGRPGVKAALVGEPAKEPELP